MSDPLSLVMAGAALGGVAGKLAEKTWESAEKWLRVRFAGHAATARESARTNVKQFLVELARRVRALEDHKGIDAATSRQRENHPQFATTMQAAVLAAAQTDDREKHALLADLITARLSADSDTTLAMASELACKAVAQATPRQLQLMGLAAFIQDIRPRHPMTKEGNLAWLKLALGPFEEMEFAESDALHLVAIGCASFIPTLERKVVVLLKFKLGMAGDKTGLWKSKYIERSEHMEWLESIWAQGLSGVQLTSVGCIIGGLVFDRMTGARSGLPQWK